MSSFWEQISGSGIHLCGTAIQRHVRVPQFPSMSMAKVQEGLQLTQLLETLHSRC